MLARAGPLAGRTLPPDAGDPYVQALLRLARRGRGRLAEQLLVFALVEARSCERLLLLGEARSPTRGCASFYRRLAQAEAGHERLFVDLARVARRAASTSTARLAEMADEEAAVVAALPLLPRIH